MYCTVQYSHSYSITHYTYIHNTVHAHSYIQPTLGQKLIASWIADIAIYFYQSTDKPRARRALGFTLKVRASGSVVTHKGHDLRNSGHAICPSYLPVGGQVCRASSMVWTGPNRNFLAPCLLLYASLATLTFRFVFMVFYVFVVW